MPDFMIAKVGRKRIGFAKLKADCTKGVDYTSAEDQEDSLYSEPGVEGQNEEYDKPAHADIANVRYGIRHAGKKHRFDDDPEDCQAPYGGEKQPAQRALQECETEWGVGPGDQ